MHPLKREITAKQINNAISHCMRFLWRQRMIVVLIVLFVIQNHLFNTWLGIPVVRYIGRSTLVGLSLGTLFFGPSVCLPNRFGRMYLAGLSVLISIVFVAQFLYHSYSDAFLQFSALRYIGQSSELTGTIKTLLTAKLLVFVLGPILLMAAWIRSYRHSTPQIITTKKERIVAALAIVMIAASGYSVLFIREQKEWGNTKQLYRYNAIYDMDALVSKAGIINFSLGDALGHLLNTRKASAAELTRVEQWAQKRNTQSQPSNAQSPAQGRNLILIFVESLETSVMNQKVAGQEITPRLNQLAKDGMYFPNYAAQIGPGTTADAEFSVLNSLYPLQDSAAFIEKAYSRYHALPQFLQEHGYATATLHGDVPSFWNRANVYPHLGYQHSWSRDDFVIPRSVAFRDLGDEDFFRQSVPKLQTLVSPFMASLITLSSHTPFILANDLQVLKFPPHKNSIEFFQQQYLQSVHYTDQSIGVFIDELKRAALYDNSLILIFGDHGSFANVHKLLNEQTAVFPALQNSQVPLILLAPNTNLKGLNPTPASHIDIYPTVAQLLGFTPPETVLGKDILNNTHPVVVYRNIVSGTIASVVTDNIGFEASTDGVFAHGTCIALPQKIPLPVEHCREILEEQTTTTEVSDLVVRNNRLDLLNKKSP